MTDDARSPDAPPSRKRALAIVATLVFAGLIVPLVAILFAMRSCSRPAMSGRLELTGGSLGAYRVNLDRCRSTVTPDEVELGTAATPLLVRVTLDPLDGPVLTVHDQTSSRTLTVPARPCTGFIARLTRTSAEGAASFTYNGEITGTCPLPGGGTVVISSWFRACGG